MSVSRDARAGKVGDVRAVLRVGESLDARGAHPAQQRQLLAAFCRFIGQQMGASGPAGLPADLPRRVRETLLQLLQGDSEKEIATKLHISRNTVHVYVKALYRRFGVSSRGELLARFLSAGQAGVHRDE
jgi:DNA-binding NarL/FixJ family response regulator